MAEDVTAKCAGLYLQPNDVGAVPPGALAQAENVVLSRDDLLETRRGFAVQAQKALTRLFSFKGYLVGWGSGVLTRSLDSAATWTDYAGSFPAVSGSMVRAAEQNGNLYLGTGLGVQRLDAIDGTPEPAGAPAGLDVQATLSGAGTAQPADSQVAFRVAWGKRDASGNLILGSPSPRTTVANAAGGSTQNQTVSTTIPAGAGPSHFYQVYRSAPSVGAGVDPGDTLGLIYEAPTPSSVAATGLSRASNVVTATTGTAHGFAAGQQVRIGPGGSASGGTIAAVGSARAGATSSDGITWTGRTLPTGNWNGLAWNGTTFVAVGNSASATSTDGITWAAHLMSGAYNAVRWNGSLFVAVGSSGAISTSPDGATWTLRTSGTTSTLYAVEWTGSLWVAVGFACVTSPDGITWTTRSLVSSGWWNLCWNGSTLVAVASSVSNNVATSPDGITWTARTAPIDAFCVAWSGSAFAAIGLNGSGGWISATSPDGVTWSTGSIASANWRAVSWTGSQFVAVGTNACATSPDGVTWTPRTIPAGDYFAAAASGAIFSPGERVIVTVPDATHFTYAETGGNGSIATPQTVQPLTASFVCTVPASYSGAALYTNETQEGILNQNDPPPLARDFCMFRGMAIFANVTDPAFLRVDMLAVGPSLGLQSGDTITINGVTWTAGASENIASHTFALGSSGIPSADIASTSSSLIRIVNRTRSSPVTATDVADPNTPPGAGFLRFVATNLQDTLTLSVSRPSAWKMSGATTASPVTQQNGIRWSKLLQPDAVPAKNGTRVASADRPVLRVVPTRDSVMVFKSEDGLFKLSGLTPETLRLDPFDYNTHIVAPETAYALDNKVFLLTEQGVAAATDTGVELVSRPIETALFPLLAGSMRAVTVSLAFAIGVESDRKYILFLPSQVTDTACTQAYVYDLITRGWTHWNLSASHGLSNGADDRIYLCDGASAMRERKDFLPTDYADETYPLTISSSAGTALTLSDASGVTVGDVIAQGANYGIVTGISGSSVTLDRNGNLVPGAALGYVAIQTDVEWIPKFSSPGMFHAFLRAVVMFRSAYFASAQVSFSTDIDTNPEAVTIAPGWAAIMDHPTIRIGVPRNKARGGLLRIHYTHRQAWSPSQIQALGVTYTPGTTPVRLPTGTTTAADALDTAVLY